MHRTSFFVCIPISFSLVYRSGAFGWIDAAQVSNKKNLSHTYPASSQTASSCAVDIVIIVFCRFFALRIAVYSYIYCSFGRLSIELYSPYMIMINRYTGHCYWIIMGPSRLGEMSDWFGYHPLSYRSLSVPHGWRGGQTLQLFYNYGGWRGLPSGFSANTFPSADL
jgi:hypothetical protein